MTALSSPATAARRLLAARALTASLLMTVGGPAHAPAAPTARATAPLATVPADETPVLTAAAVESIALTGLPGAPGSRKGSNVVVAASRRSRGNEPGSGMSPVQSYTVPATSRCRRISATISKP